MDANGIEEADLNEIKVEFENNVDATEEKMETLTGQKLQLTWTSAIHNTPQVEDKLRWMSINAPNFTLIYSLVFLGGCYLSRDETVVYDHVSEDTNLTLFRVLLLKEALNYMLLIPSMQAL
ncbi:hypothetical protein TSUD_168120 [Trifolium subterraneum]|nr:hypothetical protein TSUD_168120 [Trifolium subterraneum]